MLIEDRIREFVKGIALDVFNGETEKFMFLFGEELARERGENGARNYLEEIEELEDGLSMLQSEYDDLLDDMRSLQFEYNELEEELETCQHNYDELEVYCDELKREKNVSA